MPFLPFTVKSATIHRRVRLMLSLFATLAFIAAPPASAELSWAQKTVELKADARSLVLEAHFHFTNAGTGPVEIRNVESSCGCTTAALEKRTYQPGEKGEIVAKYTAGAHTGRQEKTLLVQTDDGRAPTTLTLVVHIPEILRVAPTTATWTHNEATTPKHITLELKQEGSIDEISVESSSPRITAQVVPVAKGQKYDLIVSPETTDRFLYAKLTIHCRFGAEQKMFVAYATVAPSSGDQ